MQLIAIERARQAQARLPPIARPAHGASRPLPDADCAPATEPEPETDGDRARRRHRNAVLYSAADVVTTPTKVRNCRSALSSLAAY